MKYYKAYDKRYKKVHENHLSWASNNNSKIVEEVMIKYNILSKSKILEIGCGEGRDARYLLRKGYNIYATDVSEEAIKYCIENDIEHKDKYQVLDILENNNTTKYDFIYSVACLHMLVLNDDRRKYYKFIYTHLKNNSYALILSMGDGKIQMMSNINDAFKETKRIHEETKKEMYLPTTSCRIVNMQEFKREANENNFLVVETGITKISPDFNKIMYMVIKKVE